MSFTKTDYSEEIKAFLEKNYEPIDSVLEEDDLTETKSLFEITRELHLIFPSRWVYEDDVYAALKDLGFKVFSKTTPEVRDDKGTLIMPERTAPLYFLRKK